MIVDIQTRRLRTIGQLRAFVEGNEAVDFQPRNRDEAYGQMSGLATREVLRRQHEVFREARSGAQATPSPFLNFHRPCLFATEYHDANGRVRRKYLAADVMTPYAKLRSLPGANQFLKPGVDFALLDAVAAAETDLEAARPASRPNAANCSWASATAWPPPAP